MTVSITRLLFLLVLFAGSPLGLSAASQPNIIFFLSDDHRWDRLGCAGHPILKTPTLDSLAAGAAVGAEDCEPGAPNVGDPIG